MAGYEIKPSGWLTFDFRELWHFRELFLFMTWRDIKVKYKQTFLGLAGLCHVHSNSLVQTVIQSHSPAEFRGRMTAIFNMNQVFVTIGSLLIGTLSLALGARWAVVVMGAIGSLSVFIIFVAMPRARHIR